MNALVEKLRREFTTTGEVRLAASYWGELQETYDAHPCHSEERRRIGAEIADCVEEIADGIESSRLASWVGFIGDPAGLRRDAESWRNGDPQGEEACPHGL